MKIAIITKNKFVKYHLNGIPINFRERSNGPMNLDDMHQLIEYFCNHIDEKRPTTRESYDNILLRMINAGLLTEKQKDYFLNKVL